MASQEQLQTRLEEAEEALHDLMKGTLEVSVSYNGREVQYNRANIGHLRAYIRELKVELGEEDGRSPPVRVFF